MTVLVSTGHFYFLQLLCHADVVSHCCADAIFCDIAPVCKLKHLYFQAFQLNICQQNSHASVACPLILRLLLSSEISYIITPELLKNCSEEGRKFN